jgi:hypothetical protein
MCGVGVATNAQKKVVAVAAAIFGDGEKLFFLPPDHEPGTDGDGSFEPDAGSGRGSVFQGCGGTIGRSGGVLPRNLGDGPQGRSWFDVTAFHAMFIGLKTVGFSYGRIGTLRARSGFRFQNGLWFRIDVAH